MRRNSKSKSKGPASFVIGEEAIVEDDESFGTVQPGPDPEEGTAEARLKPASPGGGAESPAAPRRRSSEDGERTSRWTAPTSRDSSAFATDIDAAENAAGDRDFRQLPSEDTDELPAPIALHSSAEGHDLAHELTYPSSRPDPLQPDDAGERTTPAEAPTRSRSRGPERGAPLASLTALRRKATKEAGPEPVEGESITPRLNDRERRGALVAGVLVLLVAVVALSGALKGEDSEQGSSGDGDRLALRQENRDERRADRHHDRLVERRQQRIEERHQERLAARREQRQEAREAEQAEEGGSTPAPVEAAPVTSPVPAPAPTPVTPAPAPNSSGDNIAGNEWGP